MQSHFISGFGIAAICLSLGANSSKAADNAIEQAAEKLVAATVTVRSVASSSANDQPDRKTPATSRPKGASERDNRGADNRGADKRSPAGNEVTVFSGVSLGRGLIVTFHAMPEAEADWPRFRITLRGGDQAEATLCVLDRHSGLILLEIDNDQLPELTLARGAPKLGSAVLTAAAAGVESPAVSAGILGAVERTPTGIDLPPLLQCDLRTTETSSGAAVVDSQGELLGIVAATGQPGSLAGWTYALPARHIERVVAAKVDGKTIELKRRRPVVGFTLGGGEREGTVLVERVNRSGPAADAGIQAGDLIVETDGVKIRSAYQAIDQILKKQPGDRISFLVQRGNRSLKFDVLLEGGALSVAAAPPATDVQVGPQLCARRVDIGEIRIQANNARAEVSVDPERGETRRSVGNEPELLRLQLEAYERVIEGMQREIGVLRRETSELRERLKERGQE
jgi:S1-C subfamily serine protease